MYNWIQGVIGCANDFYPFEEMRLTVPVLMNETGILSLSQLNQPRLMFHPKYEVLANMSSVIQSQAITVIFIIRDRFVKSDH